MTWLNSIYDLQYYNMSPGIPCFCEILYYPSDLTLQGSFPTGSGNYTLVIETYSADGLTLYETATPNFAQYFAVNPVTNQHFFTAQLKSYTTAMCTYACYILRAVVTDNTTGNTVFDKYTERYCQSTCCDLARDIDFEQGDVTVGGGIAEFAQDPILTVGATDTSGIPAISVKATECGDPLITLRTRFTCYDYFDGNYYGTPSNVLSGTAFDYYKVTNMRGRIVKRPRSIERTYSYNCRLQRVESQRVYLFEAYEYFPAWKADEIESQLHSNEIYVDDVRYEFQGGAPFTMASECKDIFRLKTTLTDCIQRQVFGCNPDCNPTNFDGAQGMFIVPSAYEGGEIYDENKALIAEDYEGFLAYLRNMDGVTAVDELATSPLSCDVYGAVSITSFGYVPGSFYYDSPVPANRMYQLSLDAIEDICPTYGTMCVAPVIGAYYVEEQVCTAPVIGSYYVEEDNSEIVVIEGNGEWTIEGTSSASVNNGVVSMNLESRNNFMSWDASSPSSPVYINGDIIAVVSANGRPENPVTLNSVNSELTDENVMTIETNGFIRYFGYATEALPGSVIVELNNIFYNV